MAHSILTTKLFTPPPRPNQVKRPRLIQRLEEGLEQGRRLTLVSAPAGFGKTTLMIDWICAGDYFGSVAWVSLDEGDNDPVRFLNYLVAALQQVDGTVGQTVLPALHTPQQPPLPELVAQLINDITAADRRFLLVLDDYHLIGSLAVHQLMQLLLERQPVRMHVVILTREDPMLPMPRLRSRGQVTEIRERDLRFTELEAVAFFQETMKLDLDPQAVSLLETRTEGWIAGLQLAAVSLQQSIQANGCKSLADFIQDFTGNDRYVMEYLIDEVLCCQTPEVQKFLLYTSILERFNADLCATVMSDGPPDSAQMPGQHPVQNILEYLDRSNLFLIPLDNHREWYRYHHLLSDLLQFRLKNEQGSHTILALRRKAAHWYAEHEWIDEAAAQAAAACDFEWLADLLEKIAQNPASWSRGEVNRLIRWLGTLPPEIRESRPSLSLHVARALHISGNSKEGMVWLAKAEAGLSAWPPSPEKNRLRGIICSNQATFAAMDGREQDALAAVEEALRLLPAEEMIWRTRTLHALALSSDELGDLSRAGQVYEETIRLSLSSQNVFLALSSMGNLIGVLLRQGQLRKARQYAQECAQLAAENGQHTPAASLLLVAQAAIQFECCELAEAEKTFLKAVELAEKGGIGLTLNNSGWLPLVITIRWMLGDRAGALAALQQLDHSTATSSLFWRRRQLDLEARRAHLALALGDLAFAQVWARRYEQLGPTEFNREEMDIILARVYLAEKRTAKALTLLEGMLPGSRQNGRVRNVIEILILQALCLQQLNRPDSAQDCLRQAIELAAPEGFLRMFIQEGEALRALVENCWQSSFRNRPDSPGSENPQVKDFLNRLLTGFLQTGNATSGKSQAAQHQSNNGHFIEALTERELEVLRLVGDGLSLSQIAQRLFLSPNTIKAHTQSIYSKLDAHNRVEALNTARELKLI